VTERRARGEVNVPPPSPGRSYRRIFFENVFSNISNVFYVLCLMLVILGRPMDALLPLAVVLINAGLSVFQEVRAKRKLDEIALLTRPTAKVVRDGQGALIQQTNAIESLSNVDTFCLDKTGTLTTNRLRVEDVRPLGYGHSASTATISALV
jgi:magnesium-transporting ATPase (P-type)